MPPIIVGLRCSSGGCGGGCGGGWGCAVCAADNRQGRNCAWVAAAPPAIITKSIAKIGQSGQEIGASRQVARVELLKKLLAAIPHRGLGQ
jgi:hypothetical protein